MHVTAVHKTLSAPQAATTNAVDEEVMRAFISHAQSFDPVIPPDLHQYIVAKYVEKRRLQREGDATASYMYVTPRTLLAIIRLSQAMAKLGFRDTVKQTDVNEAIRLMDYSIKSLQKNSAKSAKERSRIQGDQAKTDFTNQVIHLCK